MNVLPTRITVSPTPNSLAVPNLVTGQTIYLTLSANAPLIVSPGPGGTLPSLTLNDGATAGLISAGPSGVLTFATTIASTETTYNLKVTGLALNGSTVDSAGVDGFATQTTVITPATPTAVLAADLWGNGSTDLVSTNQDGSISVFISNGDGTFQAPITTQTDISPTSLLAVDLTQSGTPDLVVIDRNSGTLEVLAPAGDGTYPIILASLFIGGPTAIATADLNGDGLPDLIVTSQQNTYAQALFGNGDGTFAPPVQLTTGYGPAGIATGAFITGGPTDIAITNSDDNTVTLLLPDGTGAFTTTATLTTGHDPTAIIAADFTGNGIIDLAVANTADGTVSVYLGRGDGSFAAPMTYVTGAGVSVLRTADLNGDGHLDLIAGNTTDGTVAVLLGNSDGSFQSRAVYGTGAPLADLAVISTTQDHQQIVTASPSSGGLIILTNSGPIGVDPNTRGAALDTSSLASLSGADTGLAINPPHQNLLQTLGSLDPSTAGVISQPNLTVGPDGAIYGLSATGGIVGAGALSQLSADHTTFSTLSFDPATIGGAPSGGLAPDGQGNLYGTTTTGGPNGNGSVFRLSPGGALDTLAPFTTPDQPAGQIALDTQGDIFGTTQQGGANNAGYLFETNTQTGTITDLADFDGTTLGGQPNGGVITDSQGNLFGTTQSGGANGFGTLFEYQASTSTLMTLASFSFATTGYAPSGPLLEDQAGNLYGVAQGGGQYYSGVVFEYVAATQSLEAIYSFTGGNDGASPIGGVIMDARGNLFGATQSGGRYGHGTAYELSADRQTLVTLASFQGDGAANRAPSTGLVADAQGNLYGVLHSTVPGIADTLYTIQDSNFGDQVICFYPGTGIATPEGERAVETLAIGDLVRTADGKTRPVRWIGRQTVSTRFGDKTRTLPIRIGAGSLAPGLPRRDLLLSPDHAVALDGILIQASALLNHTSITREHNVPERFTYYNIELASHELILAEGQPCETFIDNVERQAFDNWQEHEDLYGQAPEMAELPLPRAQSRRQLPASLRARLAA